jgi:hypothetical protein
MRALLACFFPEVLSKIDNPTRHGVYHQSTQLAITSASTDLIPLGRWATPHVKTAYDVAATLLDPLYNPESGPSSAAGAWNLDGSVFRLSLRVREHNNQTDSHFEVIPNNLADISACCCSTRDASLSTVVALKQERSIFLSCSSPVYLSDF